MVDQLLCADGCGFLRGGLPRRYLSAGQSLGEGAKTNDNSLSCSCDITTSLMKCSL